MADLFTIQAQGEVFLDSRGSGRALRVSWHHESDLVVLSLWRAGTCAATFRMAHSDVAAFVDALVSGLGDGYDETSPHADAC